MAKEHPHAGATYSVISLKDMTYGVEVVIPGSHPTMVTSFTTEQKAEAWIADHKRRVEEGAVHKLWRTGRRAQPSNRVESDAEFVPSHS